MRTSSTVSIPMQLSITNSHSGAGLLKVDVDVFWTAITENKLCGFLTLQNFFAAESNMCKDNWAAEVLTSLLI